MSERFLLAIEANEFERLPGYFFLCAFVGHYARTLGMDVAMLRPELERLRPCDDDLMTSLAEHYQPRQPARRERISRTAMAAVLLILALLLSGTITEIANAKVEPVPAESTSLPPI